MEVFMKVGQPPKPFVTAPVKHRFAAVAKASKSLREQAMVDGPHWYIKEFAISPAHQGKGVGKRMLELREQQ